MSTKGPKRKICIVVNSRANYGRVKSVMQAVKDHPDLELQTIIGASALLYRFGHAVDIIRANSSVVMPEISAIILREKFGVSDSLAMS